MCHPVYIILKYFSLYMSVKYFRKLSVTQLNRRQRQDDGNMIRWKKFGRNLHGLLEATFTTLPGMNAGRITM